MKDIAVDWHMTDTWYRNVSLLMRLASGKIATNTNGHRPRKAINCMELAHDHLTNSNWTNK